MTTNVLNADTNFHNSRESTTNLFILVRNVTVLQSALFQGAQVYYLKDQVFIPPIIRKTVITRTSAADNPESVIIPNGVVINKIIEFYYPRFQISKSGIIN
jgi:hypothetical protein